MKTLREQREAAVKAARGIIDGAKSAGRDLTGDEITALTGHRDNIKSLAEQIDLATKGSSLIDEIGSLTPAEEQQGTGGGGGEAKSAPTLGDHFVKHAGKSLAGFKGSRTSVSVPEYKAPVTQTTPDSGDAGGIHREFLTQVDRTIIKPYRRAMITDLLGTGTISAQAITYFVEGIGREGGFETVAEAGAKPQISYPYPTQVTDALSKIAGFIKLSDEMIEDLDFLVSEINQRLLYDLALFEEAQLYRGDGQGSNVLGLLNRSGLQNLEYAGTDALADKVYEAMTNVQQQTGLTADGLIINPIDYRALRLAKDGNDQYYGGGYFQNQYGQGGIDWQPPVWGLRTVVTPAVAQGKPMVGAFKQATTVYRKGGVRVESTNSHDDDFTHNLVTVRAEERVALAVRRPGAIVLLDDSTAL